MQNSQTEPTSNNWKTFTLGDLGEYLNGRAFKTDEWKKQGLPIIRIQNLNDPTARYNYTDQEYEERYRVTKGDILVSWSASLGAHIWNEGDAWLNQHIFKVVPNKEVIDKQLLFYVLKNAMTQLLAQAHGTGMVHVTKPVFEAQEVLIPEDKPSQEVLVKRFEYTLPLADIASKKIIRAKQLIQKFRQSVLSAAFKGKLTKTWRQKNPNDKPAKELFEQISETLGKPQKTEIIEDIGHLQDSFSGIPENWYFCQVGNIGKVTNGSTPSRREAKYWNGNIPWVSSGEVNNSIVASTKEQITLEGVENSSVKLLPIGTVLLAMIGEGKTRGRSAVLNIEATTNQNIAAIILDHGLILPKYLWYWFQFQYEMTRNYGSGSGPQALSCARVRSLPFVLAPFEEQKVIVEKIEEYLSLVEKVNEQVNSSANKVNKLTQSILAKAFRGELIN